MTKKALPSVARLISRSLWLLLMTFGLTLVLFLAFPLWHNSEYSLTETEKEIAQKIQKLFEKGQTHITLSALTSKQWALSCMIPSGSYGAVSIRERLADYREKFGIAIVDPSYEAGNWLMENFSVLLFVNDQGNFEAIRFFRKRFVDSIDGFYCDRFNNSYLNVESRKDDRISVSLRSDR